MVGSLALQVSAIASHVERGLDVLLMLESSEKVAQTGKKEKHRHYNKRGGLKRQTQELDHAHQQVEAATWPVVVKVTDEVGECISQRTDSQQEWDLDEKNHQALHKTDDGEDDHQVEVKDIGHSQRNTQEDCEDSDPLTIK